MSIRHNRRSSDAEGDFDGSEVEILPTEEEIKARAAYIYEERRKSGGAGDQDTDYFTAQDQLKAEARRARELVRRGKKVVGYWEHPWATDVDPGEQQEVYSNLRTAVAAYAKGNSDSQE